jgi:hypothetical protein
MNPVVSFLLRCVCVLMLVFAASMGEMSAQNSKKVKFFVRLKMS